MWLINFTCRNLHTLTLKNIFGFILNIPNEQSFWRSVMSLFTASKRHWIAVRQIDSLYYNFDSKLKDPAVIGDVSIHGSTGWFVNIPGVFFSAGTRAFQVSAQESFRKWCGNFRHSRTRDCQKRPLAQWCCKGSVIKYYLLWPNYNSNIRVLLTNVFLCNKSIFVYKNRRAER